MPVRPMIPAELRSRPFRGSAAVRAGLITRPMLRGTAWRRLLRDVYVHRDLPVDHRIWCRAVALTLPAGAGIGGLSAAALWGLDCRPERVSVVVPRHRNPRPVPQISAHHTVIAGSDLTDRGGVPLTTPERTAFDLGRRLPRAEALALLDAMLHRHLLRRDVLLTMASERQAWPGGRSLLQLLTVADPRAESPMESRLRLLLADAGVPAGVPQFEVRDDLGRLLARVDLAWPESGLIVEYDGDHHRSSVQFRRDVARLNTLRMAGWEVLRLTADDVLRHPGHVVALVSTALAAAADHQRRCT